MGLIVALLVLWLIFAVVGFVVKSLFWLAILGIVLFVATGVFGAMRRRSSACADAGGQPARPAPAGRLLLGAQPAAELDAARLLAEQGQDGDGDQHRHDRGGQRERVAVARGEPLLDGQVERGQAVAELVGHAGVEAADGVGRHLGEVRGDHAPGALHDDLHEERAQRQPARGLRPGEQRHDRQAEQRAEGDGVAAAVALRERAEGDPADRRADVVEARRSRWPSTPARPAPPSVVRLEEGRVDVLRAVAHPVEGRHEQHQVDEAPQHGRLSSTSRYEVFGGLHPRAGVLPDLRLAHAGPDEQADQRRDDAERRTATATTGRAPR